MAHSYLTRRTSSASRSPVPGRALVARDRGRAVGSGVIQPKMVIGSPNNESEREADRVADTIMRKCASCEAKSGAGHPDDDDRIAREPAAGAQGAPPVSAALQADIDGTRRAGGVPMTPEVRGFFEPRLGRSLSDVRIHANAASAGLARKLDARAFTLGRDVFFGSGEYQPRTTPGRWLLAHELTHTVQHAAGRAAGERIRRALAAPPAGGHAWARPCTANAQKIADGAKARAETLIDEAIQSLENIKGRHAQDPSARLEGFTADSVRNAFGDDLQEIEGISGGMQSVTQIVENLSKIRSGLPGITVTCADQSIPAVYDACNPPDAAAPNAAFVDPSARSIVFLCTQKKLTAADIDNVAETIIHEGSHAILGTGHSPLGEDDNEGLQFDDIPTLTDCRMELGVTTNEALNNAYSYEALVSCLSGTEPGLKQARADRENAEEKKKEAEQLVVSGGKGATKLMKRLEKDKLVLPNGRNAERAEDLLFLDRWGSEAFDLTFDQRVRANAAMGNDILRSEVLGELERDQAQEIVKVMSDKRKGRAARLLERLEKGKLVLRVPRNAQRARDLYVLIRAKEPGFSTVGEALLKDVVDLF